MDGNWLFIPSIRELKIYKISSTPVCPSIHLSHYSDILVSAMASQITGVLMVGWTICSGADQRKHWSSESLAFVKGIHRWPVNSPHKGPVTRKMFPFDDIIMCELCFQDVYMFSLDCKNHGLPWFSYWYPWWGGISAAHFHVRIWNLQGFLFFQMLFCKISCLDFSMCWCT